MDQRQSMLLVTVALTGILVGAASLWLVQAVWDHAVEFDADPTRRPGVKDQLMRRKSEDLQVLIDALLRGDLDRIEPAARRIASYSEAIYQYLGTDMYKRHGADYEGSLEALIQAAQRRDRDGARDAVLRLEGACIGCHYLLNGSSQSDRAP